jgi:hypothetical protein
MHVNRSSNLQQQQQQQPPGVGYNLLIALLCRLLLADFLSFTPCMTSTTMAGLHSLLLASHKQLLAGVAKSKFGKWTGLNACNDVLRFSRSHRTRVPALFLSAVAYYASAAADVDHSDWWPARNIWHILLPHQLWLAGELTASVSLVRLLGSRQFGHR